MHRKSTARHSRKARTTPLLAWVESRISSQTKRAHTGRFAQRFHGCRVPGCKVPHYSKGFCRGHLTGFASGKIDAEGIPVRRNRTVLGAHLREFRRGQNWNQERLADLLGISKSWLQALETSHHPLPDRIAERLSTLQRALAAAAIKADTEKPRRHFRKICSVT